MKICVKNAYFMLDKKTYLQQTQQIIMQKTA